MKLRGVEGRILFVGILFLVLAGVVIADTSLPSSVSLNVLTIRYSSFDSVSPDFDLLNESELSNVSNVFFENSLYGKVEFLEELDIISMSGGDFLVDFDGDLNISDNLIVVDDLNLPGINKSARLAIRGLSFSEPEIYNKGVLCSSCVLESYSGGEIVFSTFPFEGPYYIREKVSEPSCGDGSCDSGEDYDSCPSDCEAPSSGGGGGGGGGSSSVDTTTNVTEEYDPNYDFKILPSLLEVKLRKGTYIKKIVRVENNGSYDVSINMGAMELSDLVFPESRSIVLKPGEFRDVGFDIYVPKDYPAEVYLDKIVFKSKERTRSVDLVLQVLPREALFDIRVEVLKEYINPEGRVRANISMINMGDLRNFDVNLDYKMIDFDKNSYVEKGEQFAINVTHSGIYYLDVPRDVPVGNYIFYSVVRYKDINATSYDTFTVERISTYAWFLLIGIVIVMIIFAIIYYRKKKESKEIEALKKNVKADNVIEVKEEKKAERALPEDLPLLP